MVSQYGTLTYRARSDGSPYAVINRARGTYTELPEAGDEVDCGDVLYRVDDKPVLLLCGTIPAYRDLHEGDAGTTSVSSTATWAPRVRDAGAARPVDHFTSKTAKALKELQPERAWIVTGALTLGRRGVPARVGADRQGDRRARRIRPAGCTGRCRPPPTRSRCRWTSIRRSRVR